MAKAKARHENEDLAWPPIEGARDTLASALQLGDTPQAWRGRLALPSLLLLDAGVIAGVGLIAGAPRLGLAFGLLQPILVALSGITPGYGFHPYEILRRRTLITLELFVAGVGLSLAGLPLGPISALAAMLGAGLGLQLLLRPVLRRGLQRIGAWGQPVRIGGPGEAARLCHSYLSAHPCLGLRPAGQGPLLLTGPCPDAADLAVLRRQNPQGIWLLADLPGVPGSGLRPADTHGRVGLRLAPFAPLGRPTAWQRGFDLVLAFVLLLSFAPLITLAARAVRRADPGPAFYRQYRDGLDGGSFPLLKLRSMYQDADSRLQRLLSEDPNARREWQSHYKLREDPRILPKVGRLIRKTSIDELPQLINVLQGDMRLVGPRPFPPYHLEAMDPAFRAVRSRVLPGLTGLWQISGRSSATLAAQQDLDRWYIDNHSPWIDLQILFATARVVVKGDGAC